MDFVFANPYRFAKNLPVNLRCKSRYFFMISSISNMFFTGIFSCAAYLIVLRVPPFAPLYAAITSEEWSTTQLKAYVAVMLAYDFNPVRLFDYAVVTLFFFLGAPLTAKIEKGRIGISNEL